MSTEAGENRIPAVDVKKTQKLAPIGAEGCLDQIGLVPIVEYEDIKAISRTGDADENVSLTAL